MVKGIEHIAILSNDTARLRDWYIKLFGFKVVYDNGKGTYFLACEDGSMFEFIMAGEDGGTYGPKASGIRHIALAVGEAEFDTMVETLKTEGVKIVTDVVTSPKGIKTFFFEDIDGNILHLIYRPEPLV